MPDPLINRRLGRYEIHQEIGRGGMARVYRATDTLLQRQVALKVLAPQVHADPDFARRFVREAVTAANLRHPAIITIFDVGQIEDVHFIAMEYIAGRTLGDVLVEHSRLSLPLCVAVLQPVAEALDYAHQQGAVHRDVKPGNILIDSDGRVLLTDFGIAVGPRDGGERLTQAGLFMGTPHYLSPEQVQAQPPTGKSDLYSLGIVAWEALAGRPPFDGETPQLIMAHVYTPPPSLTGVDPNLPRELDAILARALAKAPEARFAKAPELVELLRRTAHHYGMPPAARADVARLAVPLGSSAGKATVALRAPEGPVQAALPAATKPEAFPIADIFGASEQAIPPAPIAEVFGPAPETPRAGASPQPVQIPAASGPSVMPGQTGMPAAAPRGQASTPRPRQPVHPSAPSRRRPIRGDAAPRRHAYDEERNGASPWLMVVVGVVIMLLIGALIFQWRGAGSRPSSETKESLQAVFGATVGAEAAAPLGESTAMDTSNAAGRPAQAESSTGITATALGSVELNPQPAATDATTTAGAGAEGSTAASNDTPAATSLAMQAPEGGARGLLFLSDDALNLRDNVTQTFRSIAASAQSIGPAAVAPDGNSIIFDARVDGHQRLFRWDRASGTAQPFVHANGDQYHPAWSQDGAGILYVSTQDGNAELYRVDAAGSRPERLTNDPAQDDYPSWGRDGKQIIWESLRGGQWQILLETPDGQRRLAQPVEGRDDRYPRLSPDGTQLVFASNRDRPDGELDLYLQTLPQGMPRRLTQLPAGSASGPQWSPDGTTIVYFANPRGNDDVYFVPVTGGESTRLTNGPANERWPIWSR